MKVAVEEVRAPIACNQVEYHAMLDQTKLLKYLTAHNIPLVAYCPLAQGRVAADEQLAKIGRKHNASAAQVALKWLLDQDGVAAIPKASRRESQRANLDALNIGLDDEARAALIRMADGDGRASLTLAEEVWRAARKGEVFDAAKLQGGGIRVRSMWKTLLRLDIGHGDQGTFAYFRHQQASFPI